MILDTSALLAIVVGEPTREACLAALEDADRLSMSAATLSECLIVSISKGVEPQMRALVELLDIEIVPVTAETAYAVGEAHRRWGKGRHPARLNYGECFSYATAEALGAPLLFIGNDFSRTDIRSVL